VPFLEHTAAQRGLGNDVSYVAGKGGAQRLDFLSRVMVCGLKRDNICVEVFDLALEVLALASELVQARGSEDVRVRGRGDEGGRQEF
jgi:hypothetical protein